MEFNRERAFQQARENMITITELADVLTRDYGLSFRKAHRQASIIAKKADTAGKELYEISLEKINDWLEGVQLKKEDWQQIIDPACFVERRRVSGGPNQDLVKEMIRSRKGDFSRKSDRV
ncbi:hypothetical protein [Sediminibacillus dalangtanensis]|nr:hypothetical protein [Sediminibacillus dalangtanensis]